MTSSHAAETIACLQFSANGLRGFIHCDCAPNWTNVVRIPITDLLCEQCALCREPMNRPSSTPRTDNVCQRTADDGSSYDERSKAFRDLAISLERELAETRRDLIIKDASIEGLQLMVRKITDSSCYELAKAFLNDVMVPSRLTPEMPAALAQDIQDVIETFIESNKLDAA